MPCTSVRPTQISVQTVSGNGLDSGSRLPKKPAAIRRPESERQRLTSGRAHSSRRNNRSRQRRDAKASGAATGKREEARHDGCGRRRRCSGLSAAAGHSRDRRHARRRSESWGREKRRRKRGCRQAPAEFKVTTRYNSGVARSHLDRVPDAPGFAEKLHVARDLLGVAGRLRGIVGQLDRRTAIGLADLADQRDRVEPGVAVGAQSSKSLVRLVPQPKAMRTLPPKCW